jgi:hypothetical protein
MLLSRGSADMPTLLVEVTRVWEAAATVKAACVTAMLAAETSTQVAIVAWDSAAFHVKDPRLLPELERMLNSTLDSRQGFAYATTLNRNPYSWRTTR